MKTSYPCAAKLFLALLGCITAVNAQTTIYSTDFGTVANVNPVGWTFTGVDMNISTNTTSSGYTGASGGAYLGEGNSVTFVNTSGTSEASSQVGTSTATLLVNTTGYSGILISFGMRKSSGGYNANATYTFEWSTDGTNYTSIPYTEATAGSWGLASGSGLSLPAGADNQPALYLKWTFVRTGTASNFKMDDFSVKGIPPGLMRITEYMYNGSGAASVGEFVEFTNVGGTNVDMTGWSFDDNSRIPGSQSLGSFGIVQPGESVILTDITSATFRSNWSLCPPVKIIGGNSNNLGREDEINLYDASNVLVDRFTYGDQVFSPGSIRTNTKSGWVSAAGLGNNAILQWTLASVADAEASYASSLGEVGSPGQSTRGIVSFNPCLIVNNPPTIVMDVVSTSDYLDGSALLSPASPYGLSGVISDPTDPAATLGITFTINDVETAASGLTVTVSSSNTAIVPLANVILSGSGASRNVKITPVGVGYSDITVTVNDGSLLGSYVISYAASIASATPANTFWHTGMSDGSDAIALDNNFYISGDDELNVLNVYSRAASGLPLASYDYTSSLALPDPTKPEVDIEAATSSTMNANKVYWLGSMSNGKAPFNDKPNRNRIFATTQSGTGAATTFSFVGYYGNLRAELIAWGDAYGYNFTASAAAGVDSKTPSGFAAEGMVFGPDSTTLYIGMRAPLVPTATRTKAVIAPIVNFETWFNNGSPSGNPTFASPIELDLNGRGFRDLVRLTNGTYIIVAGNPAGSPVTSAIYKWTGNPTDVPILVNTSANGVLNLEGAMQVNSGGNISLTNLQVITDGGSEILYADASEAKDFGDLNLRKFRSDKLTGIDLCLTSTGDTIAAACNSFTWYGTNYTSSGTPTRLYTTGNGCDSIVTLHLTINAAPSNTISAGDATTFCQGNSVSLTAAAGNSYQWQLNGNAIAGATSNVYTATAAGNYNVIITGANTCASISATQAVTVNPLPSTTVTASGATTFCQGDSVTFTAAAGNNYQWQLNGNPIGSVTANTYVATASGNYGVVITDANLCSAASTPQAVTVNPLPSTAITTSGATTFCQGDSVTFTAIAGNNYQWQLNGNPIGSVTANTYVATASGNYAVVIADANLCIAASTLQAVTVNPLPSTAITTSGATTFCQGDSVTFTAIAGNNYQWQLNGNNISGATTNTYAATASGNYAVVIADANLCTAASTLQAVTVNSIPSANITGGPLTFCLGDSVVLNASPGIAYQWSLNGTGITNATSGTYTATANGNYSVQVSDANCSAGSPTVAVIVNALPSTPMITQSGATLTSTPAAAYQWYYNGTAITGATVQSYIATLNGNYYVVVTNAAGCEATSAAVNVNPSGIAFTGQSDNEVSVYPNPYTGSTAIQLTLSENAAVSMEVYSSLGQKVQVIADRRYAAGRHAFTFSAQQLGYAAGVYYIKTMIGNKLNVIRIIETD